MLRNKYITGSFNKKRMNFINGHTSLHFANP